MGLLTYAPSGKLLQVTSNAASDGKLQLGSWHILSPPQTNNPPGGTGSEMYWGHSWGWIDSSVNASEAMGMAWDNCMAGFFGDWREIGSFPTHLWWPTCDIVLDNGTGWGEYQQHCWQVRCCFMRYTVPSVIRSANIKKVGLWWGKNSSGARARCDRYDNSSFYGHLYNSNMIVRAKLSTVEPPTVYSITSDVHGSTSLDSITSTCLVPPQSNNPPNYRTTGTCDSGLYAYYRRSNGFTTLSSATHNMFSGSYVYLSYHFAYISHASCPPVNTSSPKAVDCYKVSPPNIFVLV